LALAEGRRQPSLSDEISALAVGDKVDAELEEMKRALAAQGKE
jgi:hypothetical protein